MPNTKYLSRLTICFDYRNHNLYCDNRIKYFRRRQVLLGIGQAELAARSSISVPTLKRMEASNGPATGLTNNVGAVRRALEDAGVEFTNGEQ
jgi:hypothetical protein